MPELIPVVENLHRTVQRTEPKLISIMGDLADRFEERRLRDLDDLVDGLVMEIDEWLHLNVQRWYQEADNKATLALGAWLISGVITTENEAARFNVIKDVRSKIGPALNQVKTLARRLRTGDLTVLLDPAARTQIQTLGHPVRRALMDQFSRAMVKILGRDGRTYPFTMSRYAAMAAQSALVQAQSIATIVRQRQNDQDLVRVSPNKSTIGDWCDAYRGKVFSISGATPGVPTLATIPNGGPPFHPWCRHSLEAVVQEQIDLSKQGEIDPIYLAGNISDIARKWGKG